MRKGDRCVPKIAVYFSGYGHTAKQAEAARAGAESVTNSVVSVYRINEFGHLPSGALEELDLADAIIYGSPTYMGGPAWQFKKFADSSAKAFFARMISLLLGLRIRPRSTATNIRQSSISGRYRSSTDKSGSEQPCFPPI
jgi:flavorubredoxin